MKLATTILALLLLAPVCLWAQAPVRYDDVAVIVNDNDAGSGQIAQYFAARRGIPERNILHIRTTADETITPEQFSDLRAQVEAALLHDNLVASINYLVTTRGVPLRVLAGGSDYSPDWRSASVDAELMLVLGCDSIHINRSTLMSRNHITTHSYFGQAAHFARSAMRQGGTPRPYDMFLVTRLAGLSVEDVTRLIDRSGPFTKVDRTVARFVFDQDPQPAYVPLDSALLRAATSATEAGWQVIHNQDSVYLTGQRDVLGYFSWGSNDHYCNLFADHGKPGNTWVPGAIADTYVSTSGRTFEAGNVEGQSRIADLIREGCTGAAGYVFEPFNVAMTDVPALIQRYTGGYNLAESYYGANPTISWMTVVVGDPKTSIVTSLPQPPAPTVAAIPAVEPGAEIVLRATGLVEGNAHWFRGSRVEVEAAGTRFDETHPLWIAAGAELRTQADQPGEAVYTFVNENFVAPGFAEVRITVRPVLEPSPGTLAFGSVPVHETRLASISVRNHGTTSVSVASVTLRGRDAADFIVVSPVAPAVLGGGDSLALPVRFTPATPGAREAELAVVFSPGDREVVIQLRGEGLQGTTGIASAPVPAEPRLEQNYPNPFNPTTSIAVEFPAATSARVTVLDALGRTVAILADGQQPAGRQVLAWNAAALPSGAYICALETAHRRITRRMLLTR
jgi:uncharacterized protein (TIGR03790 family)